MKSFFSRPYPYTEDLRKRFLTALYISLFVLFFLFVFRPFGMDNITLNIFLVAAGYGAVTFSVSMFTNLLVPRLLPSVFNEESWTVLSEIIYIQLVILIVATGNLLFTRWLGYSELSLKMFLNFELITLAVAVLPVSMLILIKQNILLNRAVKSAQLLSKNLYQKERMSSKSGEMITIPADNPKDSLMIEPNNLYYIASADNYVEVYYYADGMVVKKLIRTTMRNAQSSLKRFSQFYRCHRAYIVNLEKVKKVTGNAQGYKLILENIDEQILVSRSMNQELTMRLSR